MSTITTPKSQTIRLTAMPCYLGKKRCFRGFTEWKQLFYPSKPYTKELCEILTETQAESTYYISLLIPDAKAIGVSATRKIMKLQKLHDPYKGITYVTVSSLLVLLRDAKAHPENYDPDAVRRLCAEVVGERAVETVEKPF